ncbi:hypothetical protein [Nocardia sp. N2S4-5]|uniref:hypothetical protein n=1 Tax=Nocardia sp. N2S4-5 TaxID=3351565 RepID=UPI0037D7B049
MRDDQSAGNAEMSAEMSADAEIAALAQRVATARGKLPLQTDPALFDALSESEIAAERDLAEWIRAQRRGQRRRAVSAELSAEKRDRRVAAALRRADDADARWHRKALAARRRVSNPDARLAQLYRRAEWSSRALIGVVVLGMVWAGVNVQHNLVPSGDMSDPLYWLSYGFEAMISIPIITIMVVATTAARWGREIARGKVVFLEAALLGVTIALNAGPHVAAGAPARAAEAAVAPVMVGVVIWLHAWVSARYAQLIDAIPEQATSTPRTVTHRIVDAFAPLRDGSGVASRRLAAMDEPLYDSVQLGSGSDVEGERSETPSGHNRPAARTNGNAYPSTTSEPPADPHTRPAARTTTASARHNDEGYPTARTNGNSHLSAHNGHSHVEAHTNGPDHPGAHTNGPDHPGAHTNGHIYPGANTNGHSHPAAQTNGHTYPTAPPARTNGESYPTARTNGNSYPSTAAESSDSAGHAQSPPTTGSAHNGHGHTNGKVYPSTSPEEADPTGHADFLPTDPARNGHHGTHTSHSVDTSEGPGAPGHTGDHDGHPMAQIDGKPSPTAASEEGHPAGQGVRGDNQSSGAGTHTARPADGADAHASVADTEDLIGYPLPMMQHNGFQVRDDQMPQAAEPVHTPRPGIERTNPVGHNESEHTTEPGRAQLPENDDHAPEPDRTSSRSPQHDSAAERSVTAATKPSAAAQVSTEHDAETRLSTERDADARQSPARPAASKRAAEERDADQRRDEGSERKARSRKNSQQGAQLALDEPAPIDVTKYRRPYAVTEAEPEAVEEDSTGPGATAADLAAEIDNVGVWAVAREISERRLSKLPVEQLAEILALADESWTPAAIGASIGLPGSRILGILEAARRIRRPYAVSG